MVKKSGFWGAVTGSIAHQGMVIAIDESELKNDQERVKLYKFYLFLCI